MAQAQRVLTTIERPIFAHVTRMAKRDGVSLSAKVRDIIRDAVEHDEDADLVAMAITRRKSGARFLSSDAFWKAVDKKRKCNGR